MNLEEKALINTDFSKRITSLRFILAIFVILIHSVAGENNQINFAENVVQLEMPAYVDVIQYIFTKVLGGIAVPFFFIISSYLFFAKPKKMKASIKSKVKSIAVPYIFWTILTILLFYIAQSFSFSKNYFAKQENIIRSWHLIDFLKAFAGRKVSNDYWQPLVFQFWYLRNLIIFMIFSPLIKLFAGRFPASYLCFVFTATLFRLAGAFSDPLWIFPAFFYFSLGFYAVNHIQHVLEFLDSIRWRDFIIAYIFFTAASLYFKFTQNFISGVVGFARSFFTILLFIKISGVLSKNKSVYKKLSALSVFSFWIYAAHAPFVVTAIKKLIVRVVPMHGIFILIQFFLTALLCVAFLMSLGLPTHKFFPVFFSFITGGRKEKRDENVSP